MVTYCVLSLETFKFNFLPNPLINAFVARKRDNYTFILLMRNMFLFYGIRQELKLLSGR